MTREQLKIQFGSAFGAIVLSGVMLAGCGSESPLGISDSTQPETASKGATLYADQWIGPDGGALSVGPYLLTVPAGAVTSNTHFVLDQLQSNSWDVDMSPHGLSFGVPLTLALDASGELDPNSMSMQWWNPSTNSWEAQTTTHSGTTVIGHLNHFSRYGFE